ncbi:hypothetical protein O0L34_g19456 [Tuta absoluta]|nr:hypothetical protein O0L34_g19456 [Tuta absoluta]
MPVKVLDQNKTKTKIQDITSAEPISQVFQLAPAVPIKLSSPCHDDNICTPSDDTINTTSDKIIINISVENSFSTLADESDNEEFLDPHTCLNRSCPDVKLTEDFGNMKQKISELERDSSIADQQIELLLLENSSLKAKLANNYLQVKTLKVLCHSSEKNTTKQTSSRKKDSNRRISYAKSYNQNTSYDNLNIVKNPAVNDIVFITPVDGIEMEETRDLEHGKNGEDLSIDNIDESTCEVVQRPGYDMPLTNVSNGKFQPVHTSDHNEMKKICIISSNTRNKILTTAQKSFNKCSICHYIKVGGDMRRLLEDIDLKVKDFT